MKGMVISACVVFLLAGNADADSLYRWVDKEGKVHYGERPAEDAVKAEQKKFNANAAADEEYLPYETRRAKQNFPVTLYVSSSCGDYCVQARAMLNTRGIPYVEKNIATKEELDVFKKQMNGSGIPTLTVGKAILNGFEAGYWNRELDIAGYPKTAPYGARPAKLPAQAETKQAAEQ